MQNNYLSRPQLVALQAELAQCRANQCNEAQTNTVLDKYVQLSAENDAALAACTTQACVQSHRDALLHASTISRDVIWDIANANADERLIQELLGRQNKAGMLQYAQQQAERIERAGKEMAQYVQTHCQGLSEAACTSKLQQSQDTAGVFTEIVAGFTPAGIAIDVKDLLQAETMGDYGLAVLGAVLPGLGDGFKAAIKGADAVPSGGSVENLATGASGLNQQQMRQAELSRVLDMNHPQQGITIGNQSYLPRPDQSVNIYDGLSWDQVQRYFLELTGLKEMPAGTPVMVNGQLKGTRWTVPDGQGGSFTLRDFASSTGESGPVWTIDIPRRLLPANFKGAPEVKFGQP